MSTILPNNQIPKSKIGEPVWEVATLFPDQGDWSVHEYLALDTNHLVEFNEGQLEFPPMPTQLHQLIAFYLCTILQNLRSGHPPGLAIMAPFRVRVASGKYRQPDVCFMLDENRERRKNEFWEGADLVIEVVSPDDPQRDLVEKRRDYAESRIPEYWIVDPRDKSILVLTLDDGASEYREAGRYTADQTAQSILLDGFQVDVTSVFEQG